MYDTAELTGYSPDSSDVFRMPEPDSGGSVVPPEILREIFARGELHRAPRPVDYAVERIEEHFKTSQLVMVDAPTGTGKTTGLVETAALLHPTMPVHLLQPSRAAVVLNTVTISKELNSRPGKRMGYALVNEEPVIDQGEKSQIRAWTVRSLINYIRETGRLPPGRIIIDEADERKTDTDILLFLVKEYLPFSPDTQIILTSATLPGKFRTYFTRKDETQETLPPLVRVKATMHKVEEELLSFEYKGQHHTDLAISGTKSIVNRFLAGNLTIPPKSGETEREIVTNGSMAMILAGKEDINNAVRELGMYVENPQLLAEKLWQAEINPILEQELAEIKDRLYKEYQNDYAKELGIRDEIDTIREQKLKEYEQDATWGARKKQLEQAVSQKKISLVPIHSEIKASQTGKIATPVAENELRIIIGTDIIRRSITMPDLTVLVDCMEKKRPHAENGIRHLKKVPITEAERIQGKGRLGRVQSGIYVQIKDGYTHHRDPHPQPELVAAPSTDSILLLASLGYDIRTADLLDRPKQSELDAGVTLLQQLGALDSEGKITQLGREISRIPLDPEHAVALLNSEKYGVAPEMVIISAFLGRDVHIRNRPYSDTKMIAATEELPQRLQVNRTELTTLIQTVGDEEFYKMYKAYSSATISSYGYPDGLPVPLQESYDKVRNICSPLAATGYKYLGYGKWGMPLKRDDHRLQDDKSDILRNRWRKLGKESMNPEETDTDVSDFAAIVMLYRRYHAIASNLQVSQEVRDKQLDEFCEYYGTSKKALEDMRLGIREIAETLGKQNTTHPTSPDFQTRIGSSRISMGDITGVRPFDHNNLTKALASGFINNIASQSNRNVYASLGRSFYVNSQSVIDDSSKFILFDHIRKEDFKNKPGSANFVDIAAPVKPEWLREVMPQLIKITTPVNMEIYSKSTGRMEHVEEEYFNGVRIREDTVPITGEAAVKAFSSYLKQYVYSTTEELRANFLPASLGILQEQMKYVRSVFQRAALGKSESKLIDIAEVHIQEILGSIITREGAEDLNFTIDFSKFDHLVQPQFASFEDLREAIQKTAPDRLSLYGVNIPLSYEEYADGKTLSLTITPDLVPLLTAEDFNWIPIKHIFIRITGVNTSATINCGMSMLRHELGKLRQRIAGDEAQSIAYTLLDRSSHSDQYQELRKRVQPQVVVTPVTEDVRLPDPVVIHEKTGTALYPYVTSTSTEKTDDGMVTTWNIGWKTKGMSIPNSYKDIHLTTLADNSHYLSPEQSELLRAEIQELRTLIEQRIAALEKHVGVSPLTKDQLERCELKGLNYNVVYAYSLPEGLAQIERDYLREDNPQLLAARFSYQSIADQLAEAERSYDRNLELEQHTAQLTARKNEVLSQYYQTCPITGTGLEPHKPVQVKHPGLFYFEPDSFIIRETRNAAGQVIARLFASNYSPGNQTYTLTLQVDTIDRFEEIGETTTCEFAPPEGIALAQDFLTVRQQIHEWDRLLTPILSGDTAVVALENNSNGHVIARYPYKFATSTTVREVMLTNNPNKPQLLQSAVAGQLWIGKLYQGGYGIGSLQLESHLTEWQSVIDRYKELHTKLEALRGKPLFTYTYEYSKLDSSIDRIVKALEKAKQLGVIKDTDTTPARAVSQPTLTQPPTPLKKPESPSSPAKPTVQIEPPVGNIPEYDSPFAVAFAHAQKAAKQPSATSPEGLPQQQPDDPVTEMLERLQAHIDDPLPPKQPAEEVMGMNLEQLHEALAELRLSTKQRPVKKALVTAALVVKNMNLIGTGHDQISGVQIQTTLSELRKHMEQTQTPSLQEELKRLQKLYQGLEVRYMVHKSEQLPIAGKLLQQPETREYFRGIMVPLLERYRKIPDSSQVNELASAVLSLLPKFQKMTTQPKQISGLLNPFIDGRYLDTTKEQISFAIASLTEIMGYCTTIEQMETVVSKVIVLLETDRAAGAANITTLIEKAVEATLLEN